MWTYILRRLLLVIPTLFGVTVVSFVIMQMAPGDPQLAQLGAGGTTGESSQTREAYLIQKRDLKLDKPLILNFNYFRSYKHRVRMAAWFLGRSQEEIEAALTEMADIGAHPELEPQRRFLEELGIDAFAKRLADPQARNRLAKAVLHYVQTFCEDNGVYAVPAAIELLRREGADTRTKIGAIRCLDFMVVEPFRYTYGREPTAEESRQIEAVWRIWKERNEGKFPEFDADEAAYIDQRFRRLVAEPSRMKRFEMLSDFDQSEMGHIAARLLSKDAPLKEKVMAAAALKLYVSNPLPLNVPLDATEEEVAEVTGNWILHFQLNPEVYQPGFFHRVWYIVSDTQYAHMVWRLATFNFGRSALKTREPVSKKLWDAFVVSAPIMVLAQVVIYLVAVPLGIICAVNRGRWADRLISLVLFLLYSIPPFIAGMLFLLYLCYGRYLKIFPMLGLHSPGADDFTMLQYIVDYLWHIFLPVVCLSLFSLAGMAMYSRTSMLDVLGQDYIRTARAKGLSEPKVILKHGLRNALIPIITLFSNFLPAMLGGSVLIEVLFGIPGMGRLSWTSIMQKDYPTLMALIYVQAIIVMLSILMTDILYVFVDPRISFEGQKR